MNEMLSIPKTVDYMLIIRSEAFEESDANSRRTISFDSSTTVDDISIITFLQNTAVENGSPNEFEWNHYP